VWESKKSWWSLSESDTRVGQCTGPIASVARVSEKESLPEQSQTLETNKMSKMQLLEKVDRKIVSFTERRLLKM
jgi:hypothetical protein